MEQADAIDAALATRVIPSITVALKDKLGKEDKTVLQTAEFVLGADHTQYTKAYFDSLAIKLKRNELSESAKAIVKSTETEKNIISEDADNHGENEEFSNEENDSLAASEEFSNEESDNLDENDEFNDSDKE
jgi:hypothetical protein